MNLNKWKAHLNAARYFGKESSCGGKQNHRTFSRAQKVAESATRKYGQTKVAYPCPFCDGWHVGRKMSQAELHKWRD